MSDSDSKKFNHAASLFISNNQNIMDLFTVGDFINIGEKYWAENVINENKTEYLFEGKAKVISIFS